jgi:hypothetical protein
LLPGLSHDLQNTKAEIEALLKDPSKKGGGGVGRDLHAEDVISLLLLVGEKREEPGSFHCARFVTRLCQMNSEFSGKYETIARLFSLSITYAELICKCEYARAVNREKKDKLVAPWDDDKLQGEGNATLAIVILAWGAKTGLILRPEQIEYFARTLGTTTSVEDRDGRNGRSDGQIIPIVMGGGKTKVLTPLGCALADARGEVPVVLVPSSLMPSVSKDLCDTLGRSMEVVNFCALIKNDLTGFTKDLSVLRRLGEEVGSAAKNGGKLILLDDAMLHRIVMEVTLISEQIGEGGAAATQGRDETLERLQILSFILQTWRAKGRMFADEAHKIFDPVKSLIVTDQSSAGTISGRTFDVIHDLYDAMADNNPRKADVKWTCTLPDGSVQTLTSPAANLTQVRNDFRLAQNQQAAITEQEYQNGANTLSHWMLVKLLRDNMTSSATPAGAPAGAGAGGAPAGAPVGVTTDGTNLMFVFDKPGGDLPDDDLRFTCKIQDLQQYLVSPDWKEEDDPAKKSPCEKIDTAFSKAIAAKAQLAPFLGELRLVRGMLSCELPRCLKKTGGVNYGPSSKGSALVVYKDGMETDAQHAHLGTSIPLLYQLSVNIGMPKPLWYKYVNDTIQTAELEMKRSGKKSLADTVAGKLFESAFDGIARSITLEEARSDPDGTYRKVCVALVENPTVALRLMRNNIAQHILPPTRTREERATAALPFFSEFLGFTGTPGLPWKWDPMFREHFCDEPPHISALKSVFGGAADGISGQKKLREFTVADSSKTVAKFLDGAFSDAQREVGLKNLCGIGDAGGILYQIAANEAKQNGIIDPDPGLSLAIAIRNYMRTDHGAYKAKRHVHVGYEGKDGRRYMLLYDSDKPKMFEGSGPAVYERFGIKAEDTIWACSQSMCTGLDVPMPDCGEYLLVLHCGDTGLDLAGQAAMRARYLLSKVAAPVSQYLRIGIPSHMLSQMVKSGENERGKITRASDVSGDDIVATLEFNDREAIARQARMAILCESKRIVSNWVVRESVRTFSSELLANSSEERSKETLKLSQIYRSLRPFLSDSHAFDPATLYGGKQQSESLSQKTLDLLRRNYADLQLALEGVGKDVSVGQRIDDLKSFVLKESSRLFKLCLEMEGKSLQDSDGIEIDVVTAHDWLISVPCPTLTFHAAPRPDARNLGEVLVQSSKQSVSELPDADTAVEVQVEVEKELEQVQETLQEYGDYNKMSTGKRLLLHNYWNGVEGGVLAKELFEEYVIAPARGVGSAIRNKTFAKTAAREGIAVSLSMEEYLRRSAAYIKWDTDSLANQERYELYSALLRGVRGSANFCLSYQNVIPIFHDAHQKARYAVIYMNTVPPAKDHFTIVLVSEEEAKELQEKIAGNDLSECALVDCTTGYRLATSDDFDDGTTAVGGQSPKLAVAYEHAIEHLRLIRAMTHGDTKTMASLRNAYSRIVEDCGVDIELIRRFTELCVFSIPPSREDRDAPKAGVAAVDSMLATHNNDQLFRSGFNITDEMLQEITAELGQDIANKLTTIRPGETSGETLAPLIKLKLLSMYVPAGGVAKLHKYSPLVIYVILLSALLGGRYGEVRSMLQAVDDTNSRYGLEAIRTIALAKSSAAPGDSELFRLALVQLEDSKETFTGQTMASDMGRFVRRCGYFNQYSPCVFHALNFDADALREIFRSETLMKEQIQKVSPRILRPLFTSFCELASSDNLAKLRGRQLASSAAASILMTRQTDDGSSFILEEVVRKLATSDDNSAKEALAELLRISRGTKYGNAVVGFLSKDPKLFDSAKSYDPLCIEMLKRKEFIPRFENDMTTLQRLINEYSPIVSSEDIALCDDEVVGRFCGDMSHLLTAGQIYRFLVEEKFPIEKLTKGRMALFEKEIDWDFEGLYPSGCRISDDCCRLLMQLIKRGYSPNDLPDGLIEVINRHQRLGRSDIDVNEKVTLPSADAETREVVDFFPVPKDRAVTGDELHRQWLEQLSTERIAEIKSDRAYTTAAYLLKSQCGTIKKFRNENPAAVRLAAIFARNLVLDGRSNDEKIIEIRKLDPDNGPPVDKNYPPNEMIDVIFQIVDKFALGKRAPQILAAGRGNYFSEKDVATIVAVALLVRRLVYPAANVDAVVTCARRLVLDLYEVLCFDRSTGGADAIELAPAFYEAWNNVLEYLVNNEGLDGHSHELMGMVDYDKDETWFTCRERDCPGDIIANHGWFFHEVCKKYPTALARLRVVDMERLRTLNGGQIHPSIVPYILRWGGKDAIGELSAIELGGMDLWGNRPLSLVLEFPEVELASHQMTFPDMIRNIPFSVVQSLKPDTHILRYIIKHGSPQQISTLSPAQLWSFSRSNWQERAAAQGQEISAVVSAVTDLYINEIDRLTKDGFGAQEECCRLRAAQACILRSFAISYCIKDIEKYIGRYINNATKEEDALPMLLADDEFLRDTEETKKAVLKIFAAVAPGNTEEDKRRFVCNAIAAVAGVDPALAALQMGIIAEGNNISPLLDGGRGIPPENRDIVHLHGILMRTFEGTADGALNSAQSVKSIVSRALADVVATLNDDASAHVGKVALFLDTMANDIVTYRSFGLTSVESFRAAWEHYLQLADAGNGASFPLVRMRQIAGRIRGGESSFELYRELATVLSSGSLMSQDDHKTLQGILDGQLENFPLSRELADGTRVPFFRLVGLCEPTSVLRNQNFWSIAAGLAGDVVKQSLINSCAADAVTNRRRARVAVAGTAIDRVQAIGVDENARRRWLRENEAELMQIAYEEGFIELSDISKNISSADGGIGLGRLTYQQLEELAERADREKFLNNFFHTLGLNLNSTQLAQMFIEMHDLRQKCGRAAAAAANALNDAQLGQMTQAIGHFSYPQFDDEKFPDQCVSDTGAAGVVRLSPPRICYGEIWDPRILQKLKLENSELYFTRVLTGFLANGASIKSFPVEDIVVALSRPDLQRRLLISMERQTAKMVRLQAEGVKDRIDSLRKSISELEGKSGSNIRVALSLMKCLDELHSIRRGACVGEKVMEAFAIDPADLVARLDARMLGVPENLIFFVQLLEENPNLVGNIPAKGVFSRLDSRDTPLNRRLLALLLANGTPEQLSDAAPWLNGFEAETLEDTIAKVMKDLFSAATTTAQETLQAEAFAARLCTVKSWKLYCVMIRIYLAMFGHQGSGGGSMQPGLIKEMVRTILTQWAEGKDNVFYRELSTNGERLQKRNPLSGENVEKFASELPISVLANVGPFLPHASWDGVIAGTLAEIGSNHRELFQLLPSAAFLRSRSRTLIGITQKVSVLLQFGNRAQITDTLQDGNPMLGGLLAGLKASVLTENLEGLRSIESPRLLIATLLEVGHIEAKKGLSMKSIAECITACDNGNETEPQRLVVDNLKFLNGDVLNHWCDALSELEKEYGNMSETFRQKPRGRDLLKSINSYKAVIARSLLEICTNGTIEAILSINSNILQCVGFAAKPEFADQGDNLLVKALATQQQARKFRAVGADKLLQSTKTSYIFKFFPTEVILNTRDRVDLDKMRIFHEHACLRQKDAVGEYIPRDQIDELESDLLSVGENVSIRNRDTAFVMLKRLASLSENSTSDPRDSSHLLDSVSKISANALLECATSADAGKIFSHIPPDTLYAIFLQSNSLVFGEGWNVEEDASEKAVTSLLSNLDQGDEEDFKVKATKFGTVLACVGSNLTDSNSSEACKLRAVAGVVFSKIADEKERQDCIDAALKHAGSDCSSILDCLSPVSVMKILTSTAAELSTHEDYYYEDDF